MNYNGKVGFRSVILAVVMMVAVRVVAPTVIILPAGRTVVAMFLAVFVIVVFPIQVGVDCVSTVIVGFVPDAAASRCCPTPNEVIFNT